MLLLGDINIFHIKIQFGLRWHGQSCLWNPYTTFCQCFYHSFSVSFVLPMLILDQYRSPLNSSASSCVENRKRKLETDINLQPWLFNCWMRRSSVAGAMTSSFESDCVDVFYVVLTQQRECYILHRFPALWNSWYDSWCPSLHSHTSNSNFHRYLGINHNYI